MDLSAEAQILFQVVCLIAGVAGLAWLSLGVPMRVMPATAKRFAAANLFLLLAVVLLLKRTAEFNFVLYLGAEMSALTAFSQMRSGIQRVTRIPPTNREALLVLASALVILGATYLAEPIMRFHKAVFSFASAWIFLRCTLESNQALHREFGTVSLLAVSPIGLGGAVFAGRAFTSLAQGVGGEPPSYLGFNAIPLLWAFVFAVLAINIVLMGMALGRLVGRIRMLSERDSLTGSMNRRAIEARIENELARLKRGDRRFALAVIDLDHFKNINDTLGHKGGDAALVHATRQMHLNLRETDALGRFGGEEFVAILTTSSREGAMQAAERMRIDLAESRFDWNGSEHGVTASLGIAMVRPGDTPESVFRRADQALYRAKELGRNRCIFAEGD